MKKLGDALKPDQIRKRDRLHPQPGPLAVGEHLEALYPRRPPGGPEALLRPEGQGPVRSSVTASAAKGAGSGPASTGSPARRAPEFIMESILDPSKDIAPEYEAVAVATKDGRIITGLRINETNFSIQLREENGRFHSLLKRDLDEVKVMKKSLMPENFGRAADRQGAARSLRVPDDPGMNTAAPPGGRGPRCEPGSGAIESLSGGPRPTATGPIAGRRRGVSGVDACRSISTS